jgi:hypothetical protein
MNLILYTSNVKISRDCKTDGPRFNPISPEIKRVEKIKKKVVQKNLFQVYRTTKPYTFVLEQRI